MMSELFSYKGDDEHYFIKTKNKHYTGDEVVDLLNTLYQENDILNKNEDDLEECTIENIKLKEENEQLKKEIKQYWKCRDKWKQEAKELRKENRELRQTMQKVCELLEEEVDLFSDKATEHDVIAYCEMQDFDNKDAYYICTATKKAIQMLKGRDSDE